MTNIKEKRLLRRYSGISLETLTKNLDRHKIQYELEMQEDTGKYFRDTIVKVKKSLTELFYNCNIIPNVQLKQFNKEKNCIELNAIYNFVVFSDSVDFKIDENYVELISEYLEKIGLSEIERPTNRPIDRIRIFQSES